MSRPHYDSLTLLRDLNDPTIEDPELAEAQAMLSIQTKLPLLITPSTRRPHHHSIPELLVMFEDARCKMDEPNLEFKCIKNRTIPDVPADEYHIYPTVPLDFNT